MFSALIVIGCLALATGSDAEVRQSAFDMTVRTDATGVSLEAVSGCDWTRLTFSSGEEPHRAIVTSRGVRTVDSSFDRSRYVAPDGVRFAFFLVTDTQGFTATAIRGCEWKSLSYRDPNAATLLARLSDERVTGAAVR